MTRTSEEREATLAIRYKPGTVFSRPCIMSQYLSATDVIPVLYALVL